MLAWIARPRHMSKWIIPQPFGYCEARHQMTLCLFVSLFVLSQSATSHGRSPAIATCKDDGADSCELTNGCSWCLPQASIDGSADNSSNACLPWDQCGGPPELCELRRNQSECEASKGEVSLSDFGSSAPLCAWCKTEQRCVAAPSESPRNSTLAAATAQCVGCDGVFDSGAQPDACGVCNGGCLPPSVTQANPACWCVGCDGAPFSGAAVDLCGVCGGDNSSCTFPYGFTHEQSLGIALAVCGNLFISAGLNIQKQAHNANARRDSPLPYPRMPLWQAGLVVMVLGETGNFLAYAYAPATLVAPLGSVSVIANSVLAYVVLNEPPSPRTAAGSALAILGSVLIVTYAPSSDRQLTMDVLLQYMQDPRFLVFIGCLVSLLGALLFCVDDVTKRRYVWVYTLICSLSGSLTVMCIKGTSTALILTFQGRNQFGHALPWVLLLTTIGTVFIQMRYLNLAMIAFKASEVVPVYYVLFTLCSIIGGMALYKEYHQNCPPTEPNCGFFLYFLLGCAVTFIGVFLITLDSPGQGGDRGSEECESGAHSSECLVQAERGGVDVGGGDGDSEDWGGGRDAVTVPLLSNYAEMEVDRLGPARPAHSSTL